MWSPRPCRPRLPSPLWGGVGGGGGDASMRKELPPSPTLPHRGGGSTLRLVLAFSLALLTAGCFQPLYGDPNVVQTAGLDSKLAVVDVSPIPAPSGTRVARVAVQLRDRLMFEVSKGGPTPTTKQ